MDNEKGANLQGNVAGCPEDAQRDALAIQHQIGLLTPLARVLDVYSDKPAAGDDFVASALAEFIRISHLVARRAAIAMETRP
ncbi:hypothetical protein [Sphingomonas sp. DC2300-3]|uniref:hypothetical protein n=1 Tax=unclassified Sphingomonas TaxID=196159 RepID=UPI003CF97E80